MRYGALRGLLVHSPQIETGYAEVVIGNPNKVWLELRELMTERDRAVELLQELIAGALELDLSYESMPVQRAVEFLRELEVE